MNLALAALKEDGPIVGRIYCGRCKGEQKAVAIIRESSRGLVFDASLPSSVGPIPESIRRARIEAYRLAGQRPPYIGAAGWCVVLLEAHLPEQDEPAAECRVHGVGDLDRAEVAKAVRGRPSKSPAKIFIHRA